MIKKLAWLALAISLVGCGSPRPKKLEVFIVNLIGGRTLHPINYYEQLLIGEKYHMTPSTGASQAEGRPVLGSVREYFEYYSNGKATLNIKTHENTINLDLSWAQLNEAQNNFSNGEEDGRWWVEHIVTEAMTKIGRNREELASGIDGVLLILNGAGPRKGWAWGRYALVTGHTGEDISEMGIFAHEISHILFNQPDRYSSRFGHMGDWDVMAYDNSDTPPGFNGLGRISAGWTTLSNTMFDHNYYPSQFFVAPLINTEILEKFVARVEDIGNDNGSNFTLEYRKKPGMVDDELVLNKYEGMMLMETDHQESWWQDDPNQSPNSDAVPTFSTPRFPYSKWSDRRIQEWVLPFIENERMTNSFTCRNGASLNVMGECLWDFENIVLPTDSLLDATVNPRNKVEKLIATSQSSDIVADFSAFDQGKRLYFKVQGPLQVYYGEDSSHMLVNLEATTQTVQVILDLDPFKSGGKLTFKGPHLETLNSIYAVEKTLKQDVTVVNYETTAITPELYWSSMITTESSDGIIPGRIEFANELKSSEFFEGYLRLVMAFTNTNGEPCTPSSEASREILEVSHSVILFNSSESPIFGSDYEYVPFNNAVNVNKCGSFVVHARVIFITNSPAITTLPFAITRAAIAGSEKDEKANANIDSSKKLVLLSASFEQTESLIYAEDLSSIISPANVVNFSSAYRKLYPAYFYERLQSIDLNSAPATRLTAPVQSRDHYCQGQH